MVGRSGPWCRSRMRILRGEHLEVDARRRGSASGVCMAASWRLSGGVSCWSQPGATIAGLPWPAARCGCDQRHHVTGRGASALGCQSRDVTMGGPSWKAGPVPAAAAAGSRRDPWLRGFRAACVRRRPACPPAATWAACAGVVAATRPAGRLPIRRRAQGRVAPGRSRRSRRLSQQRGAP